MCVFLRACRLSHEETTGVEENEDDDGDVPDAGAIRHLHFSFTLLVCLTQHDLNSFRNHSLLLS